MVFVWNIKNEMKKKEPSTIVVDNLATSGLGDRMIDILNLSVYSRIFNKRMIIHSRKFVGADDSFVKLPSWRFKDTDPENMLSCFTLPSHITITENERLLYTDPSSLYFSAAPLGGFISPYLFYTRYLTNVTSLSEFNFCINEIKKEYKLNHKIPFFQKYVVVHVRRTDKVNRSGKGDSLYMNPTLMEEYDNDTIQLIIKAIERGYKNFYIASDCKDALVQYETLLRELNVNCINNSIKNENNILQSYFDLTVMGSADLIIVSAVFSTFSLFISLIFDKELWVINKSPYCYYKFEKHIKVHDLNELNNMKKCTIIGHQGWTDFLSQNGLYNILTDKYEDVTIFIDNVNKIPFLSRLYSGTKYKFKVPDVHNAYNGKNTCIICHSLGNEKFCPRVGLHQKCKYIDYSNYDDYVNIKLNAFDNFNRWEAHYGYRLFHEKFYTYYSLAETAFVDKFMLDINHDDNDSLFSKLNLPSKYISVHQDNTRNVIKLNSQIPIVNLNQLTDAVLDSIKILKNSYEIHVIESLYSFLILILQLKYNYFVNIPIHLYLHQGRDNFIYERYKLNNWNIIHNE
jgi:hypothetical protein